MSNCIFGFGVVGLLIFSLVIVVAKNCNQIKELRETIYQCQEVIRELQEEHSKS